MGPGCPALGSASGLTREEAHVMARSGGEFRATGSRAALLAAALILAVAGAGGCGSGSATAGSAGAATERATETAAGIPADSGATASPAPPTATLAGTFAVTPVETAAPTRTKTGGSGTGEPPPKPNLMGLAPDLSPSPFTCNVDFKIDFQVGNKGLGDATLPTTVLLIDTRASDGMEFLRTTLNVPALPRSSGVRLFKTVRIQSAGNHVLTLTIDPTNVVAESNEGDNIVVKTYYLALGSCPKVPTGI
jgi:hypothetical protein